MKPSLPVTEAVDVTAHNDSPLQEELVLRPLAGCIEVRVLQAEALELGRPDREVRRIGVGHPPRMGEVLHPLEEEARVVAASQPRFEVAVHTEGVPVPE